MNLFSSGRVESAELANRLGRERLPIHKKEDAVDELGFEQPMNLRDSEEGFTSARCHRYHKVPFSADDGFFYGDNAIALVGPQSPDAFWRCATQPMMRGAIIKPRHYSLRLQTHRCQHRPAAQTPSKPGPITRYETGSCITTPTFCY